MIKVWMIQGGRAHFLLDWAEQCQDVVLVEISAFEDG
jgi:hypothetical protein